MTSHLTLFVVYLVLATFPSVAQPRLESVPSLVKGIEIVLPETPEFLSNLQTMIPANRMSAFQPAIPYSALLINSSGSPLLAFCTRFEVTHANGATTNYVSSFDALPPTGLLMLPAGARKLITIDRSYTDAIAVIGTPGDGRSVLDERVVTKFGSASRIVFSLDGALLPDGNFFGTDFADSFTRYSGVLAAHRQFHQALLQVPNPSPAALLEYSQSQAALRPSAPKSPWKQDWFTITLASLGAQTAQWLSSSQSIDRPLAASRDSLQRANSIVIHRQ